MIDSFLGADNVLQVHNCDLVDDPKGTLVSILEFLGVVGTPTYVNMCAKKVFKAVSRSRYLIEWSAQEVEMVERGMRLYKMLDRYNFTGS